MEKKKKKRKKGEESLRVIWDTIKPSNISIMGITEGAEERDE